MASSIVLPVEAGASSSVDGCETIVVLVQSASQILVVGGSNLKSSWRTAYRTLIPALAVMAGKKLPIRSKYEIKYQLAFGNTMQRNKSNYGRISKYGIKHY